MNSHHAENLQAFYLTLEEQLLNFFDWLNLRRGKISIS